MFSIHMAELSQVSTDHHQQNDSELLNNNSQIESHFESHMKESRPNCLLVQKPVLPKSLTRDGDMLCQEEQESNVEADLIAEMREKNNKPRLRLDHPASSQAKDVESEEESCEYFSASFEDESNLSLDFD